MDRIFFDSRTIDPSTGLPVYLFDTSYLPSPDLINYDAFIPTLMNCLPSTKYALIMFNGGLNKISWVWGVKFLKQFLDGDAENLDLLCKVYTVHDSWFVKSLTQIFTTKKSFELFQRMIDALELSSPLGSNQGLSHQQKSRKIVPCSTLSELGRNIDITRLKISLNVYKHDLQLESEVKAVGAPSIIRVASSLDKVANPLFYHHFYQIFNILDTHATRAELIFYKMGNRKSTDILYDCVARNQVVWINDWDLWCIGGSFKKFLSTFAQPLVPISAIDLPMSDNIEYTERCFMNILQSHRNSASQYDKILVQLFGLCHKMLMASNTTKHTPATLMKALVHCLSHEVILLSSKDKVAVGQRFIKNLLESWPAIAKKIPFTYPTIQQELTLPEADLYNSYDLSYDLTLDDDEEDLEYRVAYNTTTILNDSSLKALKALPPPPTASPRKARAVPAYTQRPDSNGVSPKRRPAGNSLYARSGDSTNEKANETKQEKDRQYEKHDKHGLKDLNKHEMKQINMKLETLNTKVIEPVNEQNDIQTGKQLEKQHEKQDKSREGEKNIEKDGKMYFKKSEPSSPTKKEVPPKPPMLSDISNVIKSQKQKFKIPSPVILQPVQVAASTAKTPVIRGRKVRELARLFEERAEGLELLRSM